MKKILSVTFIACSLVLWGLAGASAQNQDNPEELLPDIDPQDIEIRSEYNARFVGLSRQPILGFTPDPRVFQIDSDRRPFLEEEDEMGANLPVSDLSRPLPPEYNKPVYADEINGYARGGVGSFISPEVQAWGNHDLTENSYIGGNLDYHSSNGHLDDEGSAFRFFNGDAEFGTRVNDKTVFRVKAGLDNDFNELFPVDARSPSFFDDVPDIPHKDYHGYHIDAGAQGLKNEVEGWSGKAGYRTYTAELEAGDLSGNADESVYHLSGKNTWAGSQLNETYKLGIGAEGGSFTIPDDDTQSWFILEGGGGYSRLFNYNTEIEGNINLFYVSDAFEEKFYLGPEFSLKYWLQDRLKIEAFLSGAPYHSTLEQTHRENRFLNVDNELRHSYSIDAEGKASFEYFRGSTLNGGVSYNNTLQYPFYRRNQETSAGGSVLARTFYELNHEDVSVFKAFAGITHQILPERFWVHSEAYVQRPQLENGDKIPFKESWGINAAMTLRPVNKLSIEGWMDMMGPRETGIEGEESLEAALLIGSRTEVQVTDRIGVYAKILNMLSQEYEIWEGYRERPFQVYGGVTIKF